MQIMRQTPARTPDCDDLKLIMLSVPMLHRRRHQGVCILRRRGRHAHVVMSTPALPWRLKAVWTLFCRQELNNPDF